MLPRCRAAIVPGLVTTGPEVARSVAVWLEDGGLLVLESGAGFAGSADCSTHQRFLQTYFALGVKRPINLWEGAGCSRVPFVDYDWPLPTKVRDFSRVVPLLPLASTEVIGRIEHLPVAVKQKLGKGTLVFLGSPLGPALLAGDREARRWLRKLLI